MRSDGLFGWLIKYQVEHNLSKCLPWIGGGVFKDPETGLPMESGIDENPLRGYTGLILLANGDTLITKLRQLRIINDREDPLFSTPVRTEEEFFRYIQDHGRRDGAHLFNGVSGTMARVNELNNNLPIGNYAHVLPPNFVDEEGAVELSDENIGTKTRVGIKVSAANPDNVDIYQIKRTVYNQLGMGVVTHIKAGQLKEMFYLTIAPEGYSGPFIDPDQSIVGVYVTYKTEGDAVIEDRKMYVGLQAGKLVLDKTSQIAPGEIPLLGLDALVLAFPQSPNQTLNTSTKLEPSIDAYTS
jgi:hypothetical protein